MHIPNMYKVAYFQLVNLVFVVWTHTNINILDFYSHVTPSRNNTLYKYLKFLFDLIVS